jgi:mRNA interferase MazF
MVQEYCRGDIFFITEGTYTGSEQSGGRPGVIVSNDLGNKHSPNVEVVFLTSREKKPMPTHVEVLCKVPSTALCENIQTVSKERLDTFIRSCTTSEMKNIDHALLCSLGLHAPAAVGGGDSGFRFSFDRGFKGRSFKGRNRAGFVQEFV